MEIDLKRKQSTFFGITGDSHTLADDIQPLSDEKAGTAVEPSRSTSSQSTNISCDIITNIVCKISEKGKITQERPDSIQNSKQIIGEISENGKIANRPDSIQDYNLWELIKSWCKFPKMEKCTMVVPEPSTTANLATDNIAGGNNQPDPSLYILGTVKTAIFEIATAYNQKLGGSLGDSSQLHTVFFHILVAAAFVNSKLSYKNGNRFANIG